MSDIARASIGINFTGNNSDTHSALYILKCISLQLSSDKSLLGKYRQ